MQGGPAQPPSKYHPSPRYPKPFWKPDPKKMKDEELMKHGLSPQQIRDYRAGRLPLPLYPGTRRRVYEETSVFVCGGRTYWGYPEDCPDIRERSSLERWRNELDAEIYAWAKEHLFAGGKNPECAKSCERLVSTAVGAVGVLAVAACITVVPGCGAGAAGAFANGTLALSTAYASSLAVEECQSVYCD